MADVHVSVIYDSAAGSVYAMAKAAAAAAGAEVRLRKVHELAPQEAIQSNEGWAAHALETQEVTEATQDDLEQLIDQTGPLRVRASWSTRCARRSRAPSRRTAARRRP